MRKCIKRLCQDHKNNILITKGSITLHRISCIHFRQSASLHITAACFVVSVRRHLAKLAKGAVRRSHDVSGRFGVIADGRVAISGMHYSTLN
jgi:hypothetical protein